MTAKGKGPGVAVVRGMSRDQKIAIVGGGLAGLSTACYARMQGFETTVLEHNLSLGGVCTAWQRGPYTIDGCIHWLTEGPFLQVYRELGIIPPVRTEPIDCFVAYQDLESGFALDVTRDLDGLVARATQLSPADGAEIAALVQAAREFSNVDAGIDRPPELASLPERVRALWNMRHFAGSLVRFRKPMATWVADHLEDPRLGQLFLRMLPPEAPAILLLMILGYLERGWLTLPVGGTAAFRDALIDRHRELGGEVRLHTTVEEILVEANRAYGVRLTDGTIVEADMVVSTASAPETVLRLLAGRYGAKELRRRLERWKMFEPIALLTYGVAQPYPGSAATRLVDGIETLRVGGADNEHLYLRVYDAESGFAPQGHSVVQVMLQTQYDWWATRGADYEQEKDKLALLVLERLERIFPGIRDSVRMVDLATPLTFWRSARSWRGAYEGWLPTPEAVFHHLPKTLPELESFFMAGQWLEPGGGVPTALLSGRQLVQILCARTGKEFSTVAEL